MKHVLAHLTVILLQYSIFAPVHAERLPYFENTCKYNNAKNQLYPDLVLTTFNTWGLPVNIPGHHQKKRFDNIGYFLLQTNSDIVCLQETFNQNLRKKLLSTLSLKYKTDYIDNKTIIKNGFIAVDNKGGLMTFSSYPVVYEKFFKFPDHSNYSFIEKIGGKGVLWSLINVHGIYINILNTHLYAGNSDKSEKIRVEQIKYIYHLMCQHPSFKNYPTILTGDFNVNHPFEEYSEAYELITTTMHFIDTAPLITKSDFTYAGIENPYIFDKNINHKLDYTFLFDPFKSIKFSESKRVLDATPVSDHFGWQCRIIQ
jgi:endonuclease/exonuclease/phosphatase family metal-dependent hydrolase